MLKGTSINLRPVRDADMEELYAYHVDIGYGEHRPKSVRRRLCRDHPQSTPRPRRRGSRDRLALARRARHQPSRSMTSRRTCGGLHPYSPSTIAAAACQMGRSAAIASRPPGRRCRWCPAGGTQATAVLKIFCRRLTALGAPGEPSSRTVSRPARTVGPRAAQRRHRPHVRLDPRRASRTSAARERGWSLDPPLGGCHWAMVCGRRAGG
jgi:hypothetical protein